MVYVSWAVGKSSDVYRSVFKFLPHLLRRTGELPPHPPMPLYIGPMVHHLYCCNSNISGSCRRYAATSFTAQPTHILCKRLGKLATACQQYGASCLIDAQASFSCCKAFKQPCSDCLYIGMTNSLLYAFSTNAVACHCD